MAIPTILARVAAGVALTAENDSAASLMSALAERLGVPFNPAEGELKLPVASSAISDSSAPPDTMTYNDADSYSSNSYYYAEPTPYYYEAPPSSHDSQPSYTYSSSSDYQPMGYYYMY